MLACPLCRCENISVVSHNFTKDICCICYTNMCCMIYPECGHVCICRMCKNNLYKHNNMYINIDIDIDNLSIKKLSMKQQYEIYKDKRKINNIEINNNLSLLKSKYLYKNKIEIKL